MIRILQTGRTSLNAIQTKMDSIANNIANVQTKGYKSQKAEFEDLVYDQIANRGVPQSQEVRESGQRIGIGSRVKSINKDFKQGPLTETSNTYDLAIEGQGFFGIEDGNGGIYLTRDGAFTMDAAGRLADSNGRYLVVNRNIPPEQWTDMDVSIDEIIPLFTVTDKQDLVSLGDNLYDIREGTDLYMGGYGDGLGRIRQGFLEESNVDLTEELVGMLTTQRAYELNTRSITAADELWAMTNNLRR
ncbi:MAG TPA: flagellar hook-basal body protein [Bacillota bacterium]|nr:flagellar hook-basal body protein [Bacillota bacterium]